MGAQAEAIEAGMAEFADHGVGAQSCLFALNATPSDTYEAAARWIDVAQ